MSKEHRLRVKLGVDDDGATIIKQIRGRSELELADNVIKAVVQSGRIWDFIPRPVMTEDVEKMKTGFKEYAEKWRRTYKAGVAENTNSFLDAKMSVLGQTFNEMYIEDITSSDVQEWLNMRAATVSKKTLKADWALLKEILTSAVEDGIITRNAAKDRRLKNLAPDKGGTKALTKAQIAEIQMNIPKLKEPRERLVMALLAYTSMRREELLGLRWENVDLDARQIHICQAVTYPKSKPIVKGTKTESSIRDLPIADALFTVLEPLVQENGYVIPGRGDRPVSEPTFRRMWKSIGEQIDLYGTTPKSFRTTFATMAVASGVDIRTTQSLMGHSTPEMTLAVYTRQEESRLPEAMKQMSGFLHGDSPVQTHTTTVV